MTPANLPKSLPTTTFMIIGTGGGAEALFKPLRGGGYILITDTEGRAVPSASESCVLVGLYDGDDQQIDCREVTLAEIPATVALFEKVAP